MDYAEEGENSGKWVLATVPNSEFVLDIETVVIAIGHQPNSLLSRWVSDLELSEDGTIFADAHTGMTSVSGVFAAGNVVTNAGPIVEALAAGKKSAMQMDQ